MILKALADYYDRCGTLPAKGLEEKEIGFLIVLSSDGHLCDLKIVGQTRTMHAGIWLKNILGVPVRLWQTIFMTIVHMYWVILKKILVRKNFISTLSGRK